MCSYRLINMAIMLNMDILPRCSSSSIHNDLTHLYTVPPFSKHTHLMPYPLSSGSGSEVVLLLHGSSYESGAPVTFLCLIRLRLLSPDWAFCTEYGVLCTKMSPALLCPLPPHAKCQRSASRRIKNQELALCLSISSLCWIINRWAKTSPK